MILYESCTAIVQQYWLLKRWTVERKDCISSDRRREFATRSLCLLERGFGRKCTTFQDITLFKAIVFQRCYLFRTQHRYTQHEISSKDFFDCFVVSSRLSEWPTFHAEDGRGTKAAFQTQEFLDYSKTEVRAACFGSLLQIGLELNRTEKFVSELQLVK